MPAASSAQTHADPVVFAGSAAGMQEVQAISYQKEKKVGARHRSLVGKYGFIHLFLRDLFCLQSMIFTGTLEW